MFRSPEIRYGACLVGLVLLLWAPRLRGPIDLRYDAGVYYITGTALAEGKGYRLLSEPGEVPALQYPPLLPALVAAYQWALGTSDPAVVGVWLRWSYGVIFALYVLSAYAVARLYVGPGPAFLVAAITALYRHSIFLSDLLFAEVPFGLVTTLFVLLNKRSDRPPFLVLTGLAGMAAFLLRTAGMALLAAWVLEGLLRRRWKQALLRLALALVPVVGWQAYLGHVTASEEHQPAAYAYQRAPYLYYNVSYARNILLLTEPFAPEQGTASLGDLAERVLRNLTLMPASLGEGVTSGTKLWKELLKRLPRAAGGGLLPPWVAAVPDALVGCLILTGLGALLWRREWFIPLYVAAAVGLICLTPVSWSPQFTRYMTPLTPFLALALLQALTRFRAYSERRWPGRGRRVGLALPLAVVAGVLSTELAVDAHAYYVRQEKGLTYAGPGETSQHLFYYDGRWAAYDAALGWLKGHAAPGDRVAASAPHRVYLKTGLQAVMPPLEADLARGQALLDSVPARYVVVDELEFIDVVPRYTEPTLRRYPGLWRLVYTVPGSNTRVYRRAD
jgi:hypothetical protein